MVVGYHITSKCIANSKGYCADEPPWLGWLVEDCPGETKVFYDLDASVAALMRLIELERHEAERLLAQKKLYIQPYRLTYYPGKFFSVDKGYGPDHPFCNFTNAGQYTDTHHEQSKPLHEEAPYAIGKAREAARIAEEVMAALQRLGLPTGAPSPIAAFEKAHLAKMNIPTIDDMPEEAGEIAYECVKGNWLEAWQLGYWETAYDYDLNGAYASELMNLLDIRRGHWDRRTVEPEGAVYGFARGRITVWAEFHPFVMPAIEDMSYTPVGSWDTSLTMQQIDFLHNRGLGKFEVSDAWWWIPDDEPRYPLRGPIRWLWDKRKDTQGLDNTIVKRILAGIWGRFLEVRGTEKEPEFGPYFNPVYGAIVEANTAIKVAATCLSNGIVPLHVAVDGMVTDRQPPIESCDELGAWRLSHVGQCIIASSGVVAFEGKQGAEEFSLRFSWLHEQMKKKPRSKEYRMGKWSPCSVARAVNTDFSKLGLVEEVTRAVRVGEDPKRMWKDHPKNGGDLLSRRFESAPWEAGMVADELEALFA